MPNMDSEKIPDGIKVTLNLMEREMAPSLFVSTFLISCGGFYFGGLFMLICIMIAGAVLFFGYKNTNAGMVAGGRVALFVATCILFFILLGDDHIFEDSTLPQVIERHMTDDAVLRHGANYDDLKKIRNITTGQ